jgi:hypothetical protein
MSADYEGLYLLITKANKRYEYKARTLFDAICAYINDVLKFNVGFSLDKRTWDLVARPIYENSVLINLTNGLCNRRGCQIDKIIVDYSTAYPVVQIMDGVKYQVSRDRIHSEVIGYSENRSVYVICDMYDGLPVTTIAANAFEGATMSSIELPNTITQIDSNAFLDCVNLTTVDCPGDLEKSDITISQEGNDMLLEAVWNYY